LKIKFVHAPQIDKLSACSNFILEWMHYNNEPNQSIYFAASQNNPFPKQAENKIDQEHITDQSNSEERRKKTGRNQKESESGVLNQG